MASVTRNRFERLAIVLAVVALCLATTGVEAASAATARSVTSGPAGAGRHAPHAKSAVGSYEMFVDNTDDGQLTLSSDGSWSMADFPDAGSWEASGKTIAMGDVTEGQIWIATLGKHGLSTEKKPGTWTDASGGSTGTWYAETLLP